jgi:hypothetical protein
VSDGSDHGMSSCSSGTVGSDRDARLY